MSYSFLLKTNHNLAIALAVSLLCAGCAKKDDANPTSTVSVERDGQNYKLSELKIENRDSIFSFSVVHGSTADYSWEDLIVANMRKTKQRQIAINIGGNEEPLIFFSTLWEDGDAICDLYYTIPSDSANNYLQITEEKNNYKEIKGEFSLSCYRAQSCDISSLPDTLHFRNGKFHLFLP